MNVQGFRKFQRCAFQRSATGGSPGAASEAVGRLACLKLRPVQYAVQGPGAADEMVIPMQTLSSCRDRAFGIVVGALVLAGLVIARISGWQAGLQAPFSFRRASGMVSTATFVIHACQAFIIAWSDLHVLYSKAPMLIAPVCWLHKFLIYRFLMQTTVILGLRRTFCHELGK